jgi:trans-2-enoyl-CoA reductase
MEVTAHILAPCGSGTSLVDILAGFCAWASEGFGLAERLSFSSTTGTLGTSYGISVHDTKNSAPSIQGQHNFAH